MKLQGVEPKTKYRALDFRYGQNKTKQVKPAKQGPSSRKKKKIRGIKPVVFYLVKRK